MAEAKEYKVRVAEWVEKGHKPESRKAQRAFGDYCRLGYVRSLQRLFALYTEMRSSNDPKVRGTVPTSMISTLYSWSSRYDWHERAAEYDTQVEEDDEKEWRERRRQVNHMDYEDGQELRELGKKVTAQAKIYSKSSRKLVKGKDGEPDKEVVVIGIDAALGINAIMTASKLQRQATGQVDGIDITSGGKTIKAIQFIDVADPGEKPVEDTSATNGG